MKIAPNLGFITPRERTQEQHDLHAKCVAGMPKFAIPGFKDTGSVNVRLFDFWKRPEVVKDVGFVFPRFHQLTGSCVGAGGGQTLFTLIAVQRCLSQGATVAFLPFWPLNYGKCRQEEGDRGQGEGAMGSSFAKSVTLDGVINATTQGLPQFTNNDGLVLTEQLEMQWSAGANIAQNFLTIAKQYPVGTTVPVTEVADLRAGIINGYPASFACNDYIGHAAVQGDVLIGKWDSRGGHQQSVHAVWDHPSLGPLYWAQNNWPASSYPSDPAGGPVCGCWVKEADVESALKNLDAEVYLFSHLNYLPAQPAVLDWLI